MPQFDRPIQRSMALGEQSPMLDVRADLDRWKASLALCQNCVTLPQGGATKRSGTQLVKEAMAGSALYPFRYSRTDGYAIEAAATKFRFFRDFGVIESGPGVPYELATPFDAGEAASLSTAQSADEMFIATGERPIQVLQRFGHTNWAINDGAFRNGPFMDENTDPAIRLYTTAVASFMMPGQSFTLKAFPPTAQVWTADNVGGLFLLREQDGSKHTTWTQGTNLGISEIVRWSGNTYQATNKFGTNTGPNPPIHTIGAEWDGAGQGVLWNYLHSGYGIVKITGYTNGHQVTCQVLSFVPLDLTCVETIVGSTVTAIAAPAGERNPGGTNRWAEGAWSARRGYPRVVTLHQDRLIAYSTPSQPSTYWGSCSDDYLNFEKGSRADQGFARQVVTGDGISEVLWAISSALGLAIGTTGPEVITRSLTNSGYLKPDDIQDIPAASEGAAAVRPVAIDNKPVYVTADGLRVCKLGYDPNSNELNAYTSEDLTIFADHISQSGIKGLAWQRDPYRLLWAYRTDGMLVALTERQDQQVRGWHRHPMAGKVNSLCAVPSPTGIRQDLWLRVTHDLPAGQKTYIEALRPFFEKTAPDAQGALHATDGWFVDCGLAYDGGPVSEVTGLADFNGETLWVLADGQSHGAKVVTAGKVTLDRPASKVVVGLAYDARIRSLKYDRSYDGGANSGRKQRTPEVTVFLRNSCVIEGGAMWKNTTEPLRPTGGQTMNAQPDLFTGVASCSPGADWDSGGQVEVVSKGPFPMTVLGLTPAVESAVN